MASRKFNTLRDPYDLGWSPCRAKQVEIKDGLTVLVGCNGSGKSTLLHTIKADLDAKSIPFMYYDNLVDGGSRSIGDSFQHGHMAFGATLFTSSEGEALTLNVGKVFSQVRAFLKAGKSDSAKDLWVEIFGDNKTKKIKSKERWILLDAIDSGLSIDNVVDIKSCFNLILEDAKSFGVDVYVVVVANEYEMVNRVDQCLDVTTGKYLSFADYEAFRKFILKGRVKKDRRDGVVE